MTAATNPYSVEAGPDPVSGTPLTGPNSRYAVPSLESGAPYADAQGWSPRLHTAPEGLPDSERLGLTPVRERRPRADLPPQDWYDAYTDYDDARRHSVEAQDGNGFLARRTHELRRAADPRWNPPMPSRETSRGHPRSYAFLRPFNRPPARNNGMHFSMADHRRTYPILGMQPVPTKRNTYRVDPTPWDADAYDIPPNVEPTVTPGRIQAVEGLPRSGGAFRLG